MAEEALHALLEHLDFGPHGLTRHEIRDRAPRLPADIYLRLPDSKRFRSVEEILDQTGWHSLARAEGEFVDPLDSVPSAGATGDGGPPAWGESPLIASEPVVEAPDDQPITGEPEQHSETESARITGDTRRPSRHG